MTKLIPLGVTRRKPATGHLSASPIAKKHLLAVTGAIPVTGRLMVIYLGVPISGQSLLDYASRIPVAGRLYKSGRSLWVYADRSLGQPR
ncbi:hypothetical protein DPMN_006437 [Dreissena polymorpha]|uniref:Uncharacterized protein n=1 Tax=Dreissena polymorpha TaxID=45954 RepID=A0A9D4RXQ8_DREPO|nr:hypothetical protein DPMN_006437 [Dreissena polymorpha]